MCNKSALFYDLPGMSTRSINAETDRDYSCEQIYRHLTVMIRKTLLPDLQPVYNKTLTGTPNPGNFNDDLDEVEDNGDFVLVKLRVRNGCKMHKRRIKIL